MANKGFIEITSNEGWVNVAQAMQNKYTDFVFEDGKTYVIQIFGRNQICVTTGNEPEEKEGFERNEEPFAYTHTTGEVLFVKGKYTSDFERIGINISE